MNNKPRKESMRQVKDAVAPEVKNSPTFERARKARGASGATFARGAMVKPK